MPKYTEITRSHMRLMKMALCFEREVGGAVIISAETGKSLSVGLCVGEGATAQILRKDITFHTHPPRETFSEWHGSFWLSATDVMSVVEQSIRKGSRMQHLTLSAEGLFYMRPRTLTVSKSEKARCFKLFYDAEDVRGKVKPEKWKKLCEMSGIIEGHFFLWSDSVRILSYNTTDELVKASSTKIYSGLLDLTKRPRYPRIWLSFWTAIARKMPSKRIEGSISPCRYCLEIIIWDKERHVFRSKNSIYFICRVSGPPTMEETYYYAIKSDCGSELPVTLFILDSGKQAWVIVLKRCPKLPSKRTKWPLTIKGWLEWVTEHDDDFLIWKADLFD